MALADGAELIVLGPGVHEFGEDKGIDAMIRKYGYHGTPATLKAVSENADLAADLSAAAHLIHGSSEGRFKIVWCPAELSREEIEGVGFAYGDLKAMTKKYDPEKLHHGWNQVDGEEIFFVANPGLDCGQCAAGLSARFRRQSPMPARACFKNRFCNEATALAVSSAP